jgi:hypothetical protein
LLKLLLNSRLLVRDVGTDLSKYSERIRACSGRTLNDFGENRFDAR